MNYGIEVFVSDRWQDDQPDSLVDSGISCRIVASTIDRHLMSTPCQSGPKLFGKGLESPVVPRDPPRPQYRNLHDYSIAISPKLFFRYLIHYLPCLCLREPGRLQSAPFFQVYLSPLELTIIKSFLTAQATFFLCSESRDFSANPV
jgi:hypothetical protein